MKGTRNPQPICTSLSSIAELAKRRPNEALRTLAHHIDEDWLMEAYHRTRKDGAPGVDGQTAADYATNLRSNLTSLLNRAKSGDYRAPPVRRVYIPKGKGKETRPLGLPTFEDKVLQRAVLMVLEAVYEQDFLDCSYGFRTKRSAHQLLGAFYQDATKSAGGWVIELDIRKYFDSIDRTRLKGVLRQRVRDGVLLRLISKWLHAGVMEDGSLRYPEAGTPQGGVISPLLANIFLHEVLDAWFTREVQPRMRGTAKLYRFADDAIMLFSEEADARRVMAVLSKRFEAYGLELHPRKTRLVDFRRPNRPSGGNPNPESFDFLGFTVHWAQNGYGTWRIMHRTAKDRFARSLRRIYEWCRKYRHKHLREQHRMLRSKMQGHFQYFGVSGNYASLMRFRRAAIRIWHKWLNRRSQRRRMPWPRMDKMLEHYKLPMPRIRWKFALAW